MSKGRGLFNRVCRDMQGLPSNCEWPRPRWQRPNADYEEWCVHPNFVGRGEEECKCFPLGKAAFDVQNLLNRVLKRRRFSRDG